MKKEEIRKEALRNRRSLSENDVNIASEKIFDNIRTMNIWNNNMFHLFLPIKRNKEVNTWPIIHFLRDEIQKTVVLSKTNFEDTTLSHIRYDGDTELYKNKFGIQEPIRGINIEEDEIDVVFVPLLAFDSAGNRVGYGKGFYDIFLAKCNPKTIVIGLSITNNPIEIDDVNDHDFPLDFCVTPEGVIKFE